MDFGNDAWLLAQAVTPLWRGPGVLQLWPDASIIFEHAPHEVVDAVSLLATPQTRASLTRSLPSLSGAWIDCLLTELAQAGMLRSSQAVARRSVAIVGSGRLADDLATSLDEARLGPVARFSSGPDTTRSPSRPSHWSRSSRPWPDLTVLALPTVEPDRTLVTILQNAGKAHLVVRTDADRAIVGPLVLPGHSPCVRCLDMMRCQFDAAWPRLLAQLCQTVSEPVSLLRAWAVATATLQVQAVVAGAVPDSLGRTLEVSLSTPVLVSLSIPAHPECGCMGGD